MNVVDRFWIHVAVDDGHWLWTASTVRTGYGQFYVGRDPDDGQVFERAHRFAWMLEHGPVPDGMFVLHQCDTPGCVRTSHLFLGDQGANMADKTAKGRARGPSTRITPEQVEVARALMRAGHSRISLARRFHTSERTLRRLLH